MGLEQNEFLDDGTYELIIGNESAANGIGNPQTAQLVELDILGVNRSQTQNPDAGAYESVEFEED